MTFAAATSLNLGIAFFVAGAALVLKANTLMLVGLAWCFLAIVLKVLQMIRKKANPPAPHAADVNSDAAVVMVNCKRGTVDRVFNNMGPAVLDIGGEDNRITRAIRSK